MRIGTPKVLAAFLAGIVLGIVGTLGVVRHWAPTASESSAAPSNMHVGKAPRCGGTPRVDRELAGYVRAFNAARGVMAAREYGPHTYVIVEGGVSERYTNVHLTKWAARPSDSLSVQPEPLYAPSVVLGASMSCLDRVVRLDCAFISQLELIDLNGNGRREVVLWPSAYRVVVLDFGQPPGEEILLEDHTSGKAFNRFADIDGDGRYEWIRRGRAVNMPVWPTAAKELSGTRVLIGEDEIYMIYSLDGDTADKCRPDWLDAILSPSDVCVGRDPLEYVLASVVREAPLSSWPAALGQ